MRHAALVLLLAVASCGGDASVEVELVTDENVRAHALALDGDELVAAFTTTLEQRPTDRLWLARVAGDGTLALAPQPVLDIDTAAALVRVFAIPSGYAVWYRKNDSTVAGVLLDRDGNARGAEVALAGTVPADDLGVVWTGERFALVFVSSDVVSIATFSPELAKLDEHPIDADGNAQSAANLTWAPADNQLVALWRELGEIRSARLSSDGIATGPGASIGPSDGLPEQPRGAGGAGVLAGWLEDARRHAQLAVQGGDGAWLVRGNLVPDNRSETLAIDLAADGARGLVAWRSDAEDALGQVFVGELDLAGGTALDAVRSVTSERFPYGSPRIVTGPARDAASYVGAFGGRVRLFVHVLR